MQPSSPTDLSLDTVATLAVSGDQAAEETLFEMLRVRFLAVVKHRVRADDQEDVVQEAMRVVHSRLSGRAQQRQTLAWGFAVLRNVVGNYYQRQRVLNRGEVFDDRLHGGICGAAGPDEEGNYGVTHELFMTETSRQVKEAIKILSQRTPRCGIIFQRILESLDLGGGPQEVSGRALAKLQIEIPDISRSALYVALHRCRERLRVVLDELVVKEA